MLYATHEDRRTHRSMQCSSETTSSLKFTWPIKIASKVTSESWGGEQDSPWLCKAASLPVNHKLPELAINQQTTAKIWKYQLQKES